MRSKFSAYLDGAVSGVEMAAISQSPEGLRGVREGLQGVAAGAAVVGGAGAATAAGEASGAVEGCDCRGTGAGGTSAVLPANAFAVEEFARSAGAAAQWWVRGDAGVGGRLVLDVWSANVGAGE